MSSFFRVLFLLCIYKIAFSALPQNSPFPGGVVVIDLHTTEASRPKVTFDKMKVLVAKNFELLELENNNNWFAVIGLALRTSVGTHQIEVDSKHLGRHSRDFTVKDKQYQTERLVIKDTTKVTPPKQELKRIAKDFMEIEKAYNNWHDNQLSTLELSLPATGRRSSGFGLRRILNGIPKNSHTGLDIAAKTGTKIYAPLSGKITCAGNYFYNGKMLFLDHGMGFITSYCHLNKILVKPNTIVQKGQLIGEIGNSGRVTGPHLHWSVSLNGVRVDPEIFIGS